MLHGFAVDAAGEVIDEVLCCYMAAPRTYTAEDVVEIYGHGGPAVLRRILRRCIEAGARPAEPGEFTQRAFLNGRLDLAQAEAVADVIAARSDAALRVAQRQLRGDLSREIEAVRAPLLALLAQCEAVIDFAEEGVPDLAAAGARELLDRAEGALGALLATAEAGRAVREGIRVAIVGRPNVGKSSLLNALLQADRAIVSPVPGTTRDTVEDTVTLGGVPVTFVDTAGIHTTTDAIERIGIERAWRALGDADLVLLVLDQAAPLEEHDRALLAALVPAERDALDPRSAGACPPIPEGAGTGGGHAPALRAYGAPRRAIVVANKCDLAAAWDREALALPGGVPVVATSIVERTGLDALEGAVRDRVLGDALTGEHEPILSHLRHIRLLEECREHLAAARASVDGGLAPDFTATDLRSAMAALCGVTGEDATEALLTEVFSRFCIGK